MCVHIEALTIMAAQIVPPHVNALPDVVPEGELMACLKKKDFGGLPSALAIISEYGSERLLIGCLIVRLISVLYPVSQAFYAKFFR